MKKNNILEGFMKIDLLMIPVYTTHNTVKPITRTTKGKKKHNNFSEIPNTGIHSSV